ncbi:hypothetical protein DH2020_029163 [Rehmannia glutinosa]|uniref:ATP-dependent RNA helicase n=1 Tax=Rehmannia glutinosa TaxID=99300 RepID=A0ABR0VQ57_REHGL
MGSGFRQDARAGSSKSLIDDEAELSDWVSGLKSSSFNKTRLYSDSENDEDDTKNGGFRSREGLGREEKRVSLIKNLTLRVGEGRGGEGRKSSEPFSGRRKNENDSNGSMFGGRGKGRDSSEFRGNGKFTGLSQEKRESGTSFLSRGNERSREKRQSDRDDEDMGEEEKDKGYTSFKELIDSDEVDDDSEEEEVEVEEEEEDGGADGVFEKGKSLAQSPPSSPGASDSHLSESRFDQCSISPLSLKAIKDAGYERMTLVQEATLPVILKGKDVLAKARTGTGKTVAFLAAAEANKLLKYHPSVGVQVVIGGTRLALEQKRMQANPCQILVATPGRLRDHIENTSGFATRLMGVKVLVLDEADHLLDMGFRKEIEKIIAAVPKQRQTLLFSATVPQEVRQMHLVAPLDKHFSFLYTMLKEHIADDVNYKILVFCTTAMVTRLVAELLSELKLNVREIHSRKPQSYRTRVSDEFRKSKGLILVTSDVSARGVDYPDVTLVIQIGVPSDRQQYIHRLGRTGRKGKEGQGILMLAPWEEFFLSSIKDLPISKAPEPLVDPDTRKEVERALSHVEMKNKEAAYQAWLGYYNSNKGVGRDKYRLVELANEFSRSMGLDNPPAIPKLVLGKMGLKNIPGLRSK